jgi:hypothetical protein
MSALSHMVTLGIEHGQEKSVATSAETVPAVAQAASGKKNGANTFLLTR